MVAVYGVWALGRGFEVCRTKNDNYSLIKIYGALFRWSRCGKVNQYQPSGAGGTRSPPATPHCLQRRTACQWAPKWPTGSGKVSTPRFLGILGNFH